MKIQILDSSSPLWMETLEQLRHDVYHLPEYVCLEAKRTQTAPEAILIAEDDKIFFLPYLLRRSDDLFDEQLAEEVFDVVSPYGYPGFLLNEAAVSNPNFLIRAIEHLTQAWRDRNICSAFLRLHPILNPDVNALTKNDLFTLNGETVSVDLTLDKSEIWRQTRSEHRNKINRCVREGFSAKMVPIHEYINDFNAIYEETMARVGAAQLYYFGTNYFQKFIDVLGDKLHLCMVELKGEITCGGLFTECCGIVQYHLGGTKSSFLKQAPTKLMFDYVRFWAKERGNQVLHLGGGLGGSQDSLYHFKAGFSKERHTFFTLRLITNEEKYLHLVNLRAKYLNIEVEHLLNTNFFPAYRSN
ncbi:peptidoglycan bridge formation glycyltransferase FemA/FemB family protein [Microcoleus sp. ARI1-B5]|uniref:GNAT family N-acetyltransferase n=1 Tax=unclassified Microcoleus TaxID=2642155 RepID=UPI002FCF2525